MKIFILTESLFRSCTKGSSSREVDIEPLRPHVKFFRSYRTGMPETIASIAIIRCYRVAVIDDFIIGVIYSENWLYPFLDDENNYVKVSRDALEELIIIPKTERHLYKFYQPFKPLHQIQKAMLVQ